MGIKVRIGYYRRAMETFPEVFEILRKAPGYVKDTDPVFLYWKAKNSGIQVHPFFEGYYDSDSNDFSTVKPLYLTFSFTIRTMPPFDIWRTNSSFEDFLDGITDEAKEHFLFHMDIFGGKYNGTN
jgi:hypothetical protein